MDCPAYSPLPGGIDWGEEWKRAHARSSFGMDERSSGVWDAGGVAGKYDELAAGDDWLSGRVQVCKMDLGPDSAALDIGAGPGTFTISLARKCRKVTAVEPSASMRRCLEKNVRREGLKNVEVVGKKWEDVSPEEIGSFDVVVAGYSLDMPDLKPALEKMDMCASKCVYLFWFSGEPAWERTYREIWPLLHGAEYVPEPKADCIYNLLYGMGIYPNVESFRVSDSQKYVSLDEAVEDMKNYSLVETEGQEDTLREYLAENLEDHEGMLVLNRAESTYAKIWWNK